MIEHLNADIDLVEEGGLWAAVKFPTEKNWRLPSRFDCYPSREAVVAALHEDPAFWADYRPDLPTIQEGSTRTELSILAEQTERRERQRHPVKIVRR